MKDEPKDNAPDAEDEADVSDVPEAPALKALLKRSLAGSEDAAGPPPEMISGKPVEPSADDRVLLANVQRKLRERSKGKFYGDGWSTSQSRLSYVLVAVIMLVTIVAVYVAMGPTGISR